MENIIENNKLITEFMGYEMDTVEVIIPDFTRLIPFKAQSQKSVTEYFESYFFKFDELKFHSDWNWLMAVVEQINSTYHRFMYKVDEGQHYCEIWCYKNNEVDNEIEIQGDTAIKTIYIAVIDFINWYNQQNKA